MKIEEAIQLLEKSISEGGKKEELKLKLSLSNILHELKSKPIDAEKQPELEKQLDQLMLHVDADKEQLKKGYKTFITVLHKNFSLIPEGHCAGNGLMYGVLAGIFLMLISIIYTESHLEYFLPLAGMLVGMFIGSVCDRLVKKEGKALLTKMY